MSLADPSTPAMSAVGLFTQPEIAEQLHRMSVDEYHRLGDAGIVGRRTELIRGVVLDKMSESPLHVWLIEHLADWLRAGVGGEWRVREGHPLTLHDSEPEPDVCVVARRGPVARSQHPATAALVIEIAVTSEKLDRQKAAIYAEAAVDEYWIVLAEKRAVEVHTLPKAGRYTNVTILEAGRTLRPAAFTNLTLPVADLFPPDEASDG